MHGESLRKFGETIEAAVRASVNAPGLMAQVSCYDLGRLIYLVQCYGGVKGWTPTRENVDKLAPAVRRHIRQLEARAARAR